jgi:hypothetical protein
MPTTIAATPANVIEELAPTVSAVSSADSTQLPAVEARSGQRRGETWQEYFKRKDAERERAFTKASPSERQVWLDRERTQQSFRDPGKKGP